MVTCLRFPSLVNAGLLLAFILLANPHATAQTALDQLRQGVALHDQGDYPGAIARYESALSDSADFFEAKVEKSLSLFFKGDYGRCIDWSEELIRAYPSREGLRLVYAHLGNALDLSGKPEMAVDAYRRGLARFPNDHLLHYNLGITQIGLGKKASGLESLLQAIRLNRHHPGSHFALGVALAREGRRLESALALLYFQVLETSTPRAIQAAALSIHFLEEPDVAPHRVWAPGPAGEFREATALLDSLVKARQSRSYVKAQGLSPKDRVEVSTWLLDQLLKGLSEQWERSSFQGSLAEFYLPEYFALRKKGHLPALVFLCYLNTGQKIAPKTAEKASQQASDLLQWMFEH